jgi:hypothetical protein
MYFSTLENYTPDINDGGENKKNNRKNDDSFNSENIDDNDKYTYKYDNININMDKCDKHMDSNQVFESSDLRKRKMVIY